MAKTRVPSPTAFVRAAGEALVGQFFEPLSVGELLDDAWSGATAAITRAGRSDVSPAPDYPADPVAAYVVHDESFPTLESQADGYLGL